MGERPILFTDEMVLAILAGRKTVTRRVGPTWAGVQPGTVLWVRECHAIARKNYWHDWEADQDPEADEPERPSCMECNEVYYRATPRVGLRRWVGPTAPAPDAFQGQPHAMTWLHESTPLKHGPASRVKRWRPSIHMPRWACRLRLVVESVTVERSVLGGGLGQMAVLMPGVTDDEARLEGFADRGAFLDLWRELYPDYNGPVYRVAFHVPEVTRG